VRFRHAVTAGLAIHGTRAMDLHPPRAGARVVDIGCGFGDTTRELARRVGPSGHAVGIDVAERFIEIARAEAAGVPNVEFQLADVEAAVPGGPYELAFSRIGTMFFASLVISSSRPATGTPRSSAATPTCRSARTSTTRSSSRSRSAPPARSSGSPAPRRPRAATRSSARCAGTSRSTSGPTGCGHVDHVDRDRDGLSRTARARHSFLPRWPSLGLLLGRAA
jgi:hypothetical protein